MDIDMTFESAIHVDNVLGSLFKAGWTAVWDVQTRYMVADFEWKASRPDDLSSVKGEMEENLSAGDVVGIAIFWQDSGYGGNFLIYDDRKTASFLPELNRRPLAGAAEFTDLGWYVARLVPPLREIGLESIATTDKP
ncbi:hypothetical protein [Actinomadura sp. NBRC 104425]|uniref:hypothetical protein n=1 Tax=Actinomadura sp. NBRC 104425 TaxID=3032204 RepID=UPI0025536F30|nr:hypothetical protein [Actinomadura sp. NBRC 104425]